MIREWEITLKDGSTEIVPNDVIGKYVAKNIANIYSVMGVK